MRWLVALMLWAGVAEAEPVVIFAAASLKAPMDVIFAGEGAPDVVLSYGGSGAMAQQIVQGAPADVFFSANSAWMLWLARQGAPVDPVPVLSNRLVVIGPLGGTARPLADVLSQGQIVMGQTNSVPAGIYAREALEGLGLWDDVAGRVIDVPSVTAAARLVALGEVPLGVVYATDAQAVAGVMILADVPADSHAPIEYHLTGLTARGAPVVAYLQSEAALAVFVAHGFAVVP